MYLFAYLRYSIRYVIPAICLLSALAVYSSTVAANMVFLNEIHYDNAGGDSNEGVEIAGPGGFDLSGWQLLLYNGNGGVVYATHDLSGIIPELANGWGLLAFLTPGLQNGPDGVALVDNNQAVVQFLSYEGIFTASAGVANGLLSELMGVMEDASTDDSDSLQLMGSGRYYADFEWSAPRHSSFGAINSGQSITPSAAVPAPATLPLFLSGLTLLGVLTRRRKV